MPECEEILIGCFGFGSVAMQNVAAGQPEVCERADRLITGHAGVVEDFLELADRFPALLRPRVLVGQIGNLLLVSEELNEKLKNKSFKDKKKILIESNFKNRGVAAAD